MTTSLANGLRAARCALIPLGVALAVALGGAASAQDVYRLARLDELTLVEESPAGATGADESMGWRWVEAVVPHVLLDGPGEAWLELPDSFPWAAWEDLLTDTRLVARSPTEEPLRGRIVLPNGGAADARIVRFELAATVPPDEGRPAFLRAEAAHFARLRARALPGSAWFRHREDEARRALGEDAASAPPQAGPEFEGELDTTFDLFSGGRAVAENLQLDRELGVTEEAERTVDAAGLPGIDVAEIAWEALIAGLTPARDALAPWIPADQHAVFFPSFAALLAVLDEAERYGTPVLDLLEPRAEDAHTRQRYERQLCLEADLFARALGGQAVASVAVTGSDPYLRTGSDVALLFECKTAAAVQAFVRARHTAAADAAGPAGIERVNGQVGGRPYEGVRSADRLVCSYLVVDGDVALVTNSLEQAERILAAQAGTLARLADAPEYTFFRNRYPLGAEGESAFLLLTDATIRRWCGPRWRIGASRRTRALSALMAADMGAAGALVAGDALPASSPEYGTGTFQTPIVELDLARVTPAEEAAYARFRSSYQTYWRGVFDPIGASFSVDEEQASLDLTVMPLILGSDYGELIELTRGGELTGASGDPHADALFQWTLALDPESPGFEEYAGLVSMLAPELSDPMSWLGGAVSFYADRDPFWAEWSAADESWEFLEAELDRLPLALHVEVSSPLKLAAFLTGLRAFSNQAAPNMLSWENRDHAGQTYVRVGVTEAFSENSPADLALYYASMPGSFVLTLNEGLLQRAMDRAAARRAGNAPAAGAWLGRHLGVHVEAAALELMPLFEAGAFDRQRLRSWDNLPILNEWKRRFPERDPLEVHETLFHTRLTCPSGGTYAWNAELATMESTVYGCPERPRPGAGQPTALRGLSSGDFGLTFEHEGLRARAVIRRDGESADK